MEESSRKLLDDRSDCQASVRLLFTAAKQSIFIIGQNLEPELYNHKEVFDTLSQLTTTNRKADIRIITHDTRVATQQGHSLIRLAQKLPTFVQIRTTVTPQDRRFGENWLIVDRDALMRLITPQRFEGYVETDDKLECKSFTDKFLEIWEACEPDQNSRRLSL